MAAGRVTVKGSAGVPAPRLKYLGRCHYEPVNRAMREFTLRRDEHTADEFWILEHTPVYTLGQAGRREHLLNPGAIATVKSDRGGQITYHGPGQLVIYTLLDIRRLGLGVRQLVSNLEAGIIALLEDSGLVGQRVEGAPGVYVNGAKIAALGLRIRRGFCYHGIALNVNMDLGPFAGINPCGFPGLRVTQLSQLGIVVDPVDLAVPLIQHFCRIMGLLPAQAWNKASKPRPGLHSP